MTVLSGCSGGPDGEKEKADKADKADVAVMADGASLSSDSLEGDGTKSNVLMEINQTVPPPWSEGDDTDGDGITDAMEAVVGTDFQNPDTDGDGVQDGAEFDLGINPLVIDSDGDGIADGVEVEEGTDPARADTDGDGFGDDEEAILKTDPTDRFDWSFGGERWPDLRGYAEGTYGTGWEAGDIMPDVALIDQWDQALQFSQFYGYVILLDFSAGWCVPCRQAAEIAEGLWVTYRDDGFMVVHFLTEGGVQGMPATLALQNQWAESYGLSFPVVRGVSNLAYENFAFTDLYPGSIPFLVLLDRNMKIDSGYGGNQEAAIAARVEELLKAEAPERAVPTPGVLGVQDPDICDQDGDGHKNFSCGGADCYDLDALFSADSEELCDLFDRNCDGRVHEGAADSFTLYKDLDGDGYGNPEITIPACAPMWLYVDNADDCDDDDEKLNPETLWYFDNDEDGYGDPTQTKASCLKPDGYVDNGQDSDDNDGTSLGCWKMVTVGRDHSCGLRMDGRVVCWGDNSKTQCDAPQDEVFTEITAGYNHTCGLLEDGTPRCWGANMSGATTAPTTTAFDTIACGLNFCCGLTGSSGDNVACWGENAMEQSTPPAGTFIQVSARGGRHACGIDSEGALVCWGSPDGFQGGPSPTAAPAGVFTELSAGHYFNCAIRDDNEVLSWGTNKHGQGTPPADTYVKLRTGTVHSCGLTTSGAIRCWGSDSFGRTDSPDGVYIDLDVDQLHSCAVGQDGLISCWGYGDKGQTTPALCTE